MLITDSKKKSEIELKFHLDKIQFRLKKKCKILLTVLIGHYYELIF